MTGCGWHFTTVWERALIPWVIKYPHGGAWPRGVKRIGGDIAVDIAVS